MPNNITIELTPDRAEWFVLCERNREKIEQLYYAGFFDVKSGDVIVSCDDGGNIQNIKKILNIHYPISKLLT